MKTWDLLWAYFFSLQDIFYDNKLAEHSITKIQIFNTHFIPLCISNTYILIHHP
ncbi:hypothetical protein CUZ56_01395 [Saezia sanguinis]|uniref:Uncharacterized protein n=1 Tax=Saezia sanguinis TaxID=1965230 RepID=A0A433SFF0_9BURK|nr:hypothetical protein CUZ56_01395 [Saezia sanguinis]